MTDNNPVDPDDLLHKQSSTPLAISKPDPRPGLRRTYTWENGQLVEKWVPVQPKPEFHRSIKIQDFSGDNAIFNGITGELHGSLKDMATTREMSFMQMKAEGEISLGSLFPSLAGSEWDVVTFNNASFIHRPQTIVERMPAGLWFEADVGFRGRLKPISDAIVDLFRRDVATIHLSAYFGYGKTTNDELVTNEFRLRGSIINLAQDFGPWIQFIDVGIEIGVLGSAQGNLDFRFGGELMLNVDHSVIPLFVSYGLEVVEDMCILEMTVGKGKQWIDVLGVVGLNLSGVKFTATFPKTDLRGNLALKIEAGWSFKGLAFDLEGQLRKGDSYIKCSMPHCTLQNVYDIFNEITGRELESVQHDLEFSEMEIIIGQGCIKLHGKIVMNGYSSVTGTVLINQDGVSISGELHDIPLFPNFVITKASLDLVVGKSSPSGPTVSPGAKSERRVAGVITGEVKFYDNTFKIGLVVQKTSGKDLAWMVYGELSTNLSIADLVTDFPRDSEFNVTLRRVAVIASSADNIHIPELNVCGYPVQKGIQICAIVDGIPMVSDITKTTDTGSLMLRAAYSTERGLTVGITLPLAMNISLGPNMKCGPLTLEFATNPSPFLRFKAEMELHADKNSIPLKFEFGVDASATSFDGYGRMDGYWVNPFGISKRIKIGTPTSFRVGISPAATPSALGLQSTIQIDEKNIYSVGLQITQNPMETLVTAYMTQLSVEDLIEFYNAMLDHEASVKSPDSTLLRFEDVHIYACAGTTLNGTVYPPGFSFKGTMYVCDKKASLDCSVSTEGLSIKGKVQGFQIGPLVVKGATGEDATVDVVINKDEQHFGIDGLIAIPALQFLAKVTIIATMQPTPDFTFDFALSWSELLKIKVKAQMVKTAGATDFSKMENVDFELEGIFESDILNQIAEQLQQYFTRMHDANKQKIDDLRSDVKDAKAKADAIIADAKDQVEIARKVYDRKFKEAEDELLDMQHTLDEEEKVLRRKVVEAEATASRIVEDVESTLENEKLTAQAHVRKAEQGLNDEIDAASRAERDTLRKLQDARIALQSGFGNAIGTIERTEREIEHENGNINAKENRLQQCKQEYDRMGFFDRAMKWVEILDLETDIFFLETGRDCLLFALGGARQLLQGAEYILADRAVAALGAALHELSETYKTAVRGFRDALNIAKLGFDAIIDAGKSAIRFAKENAMKLVQSAMAILRVALEAGAAALKVLADVISEVRKGTEFLFFQNAQTLLDLAQNDTTIVDLAQGVLDIVEAGENLVYSLAQEVIELISKSINIEYVQVKGNLSSFVRAGGHMDIKVRGWVNGKKIDFNGKWDPMNTKGFLLDLCNQEWENFLARMAKGQILIGN